MALFLATTESQTLLKTQSIRVIQSVGTLHVPVIRNLRQGQLNSPIKCISFYCPTYSLDCCEVQMQ